MFNMFKKYNKKLKLRKSLIQLGDNLSCIDKKINNINDIKLETFTIKKSIFKTKISYKNIVFILDNCRYNYFSKDEIIIDGIVLVSVNNRNKNNSRTYVFNKELLIDDTINNILFYIKNIDEQLKKYSNEKRKKIINKI